MKAMDKDQISTIAQLKEASDNKKSVVVPQSRAWCKPKPAAVMLHQQGASLFRLFELGMYIYNPNKEEREAFPF